MDENDYAYYYSFDFVILYICFDPCVYCEMSSLLYFVCNISDKKETHQYDFPVQ